QTPGETDGEAMLMQIFGRVFYLLNIDFFSPCTLLRPKDASSGLLVDRESSGTSPSAGTGREAVIAALRSMANKFEQDFIQLAGDLSSYGAVTRNQASFNKLMDNMFSDEINWGTIVGLFVVGGAICVQSVEGSASQPVCHIADWMTVYLDKRINPWIENQGGWVSVKERDSKYSFLCAAVRDLMTKIQPLFFFFRMTNGHELIRGIVFI
uniref:Bcl-2 Bcl-2 homology region 1-3 domain-containing protein n=1 Tax=Takifugu rubripes TaxID=31033 RepID=H2UHW1_TAKRU